MFSATDTAPAYMDEVRLIEKLKQNDEQAWEDAFELYAAFIHYDIVVSLKKRGLPPEYADDIQQESWLTAVQKIGEFTCDGQNKFYHWLRAISFNHVRNVWRKQRQVVSFEAVEEAESPHGLDYFLQSNGLYVDNTEDQVILREQLSAIDRVLMDFKPREREIVLRRLLWDEKPEDLALLFPALKTRSISQLLFRARKTIRVQLDDSF